MKPQEAITLAIAAVGAVLGVINTWNAISQRRVRLKVLPISVQEVSANHMRTSQSDYEPGDQIGIEVINLSSFPVSVSEIGFTLRGTTLRQSIAPPIFHGKRDWPARLAPHESFKGFLASHTEFPGNLKVGFAKTTSGIVRCGSSPVLKAIRAHARSNPWKQ